MKLEVKITSGPTNGPISFTIQMAKRQYSDPKLYIPRVKGKPSVAPGKRWYVWFLWRNPETDKLDIKIKFSKGINQYKTVKERTQIGKSLVKAYTIALEKGWNPVDKSISKKKKKPEYKIYTLRSGLNYALELKTRNVKESTRIDYEYRVSVFINWAEKESKAGLELDKFTLNDFYDFMDYLELEYVNKKTKKKLSNTSIGNTKRVISSLFTELKNRRLIEHNFIKDIPTIKSKPIKNRPFTFNELQDIKKYLEIHDPYMISFLSFMIYPLLRPREICRLKIEDLNTRDWILGVETKTENRSYSRIIEKLKPAIEAMKIDGLPGGYSLFTPENKPGVWETTREDSRATYFSRRFGKALGKMGFGKEYSLYSVRHSAIGDLFNGKQKEGLSEREIIYQLMPLTGHKSEAGLRNYLRDIKSVLPPDHSGVYTIDF